MVSTSGFRKIQCLEYLLLHSVILSSLKRRLSLDFSNQFRIVCIVSSFGTGIFDFVGTVGVLVYEFEALLANRTVFF